MVSVNSSSSIVIIHHDEVVAFVDCVQVHPDLGPWDGRDLLGDEYLLLFSLLDGVAGGTFADNDLYVLGQKTGTKSRVDFVENFSAHEDPVSLEYHSVFCGELLFCMSRNLSACDSQPLWFQASRCLFVRPEPETVGPGRSVH